MVKVKELVAQLLTLNQEAVVGTYNSTSEDMDMADEAKEYPDPFLVEVNYYCKGSNATEIFGEFAPKVEGQRHRDWIPYTGPLVIIS